MDLIYYSNDIVRKYPKSERFALVEEIKHAIYTGLRIDRPYKPSASYA